MVRVLVERVERLRERTGVGEGDVAETLENTVIGTLASGWDFLRRGIVP